MKRYRLANRSILIYYLLSYICVATIACTAIGMLLQNRFTLALVDNIRNTQLDMLSVAINDIDNQKEFFQDVVINIRTKNQYNPKRFIQNKYYEILLIEDFKKYVDYSQISNEYFLLYRNSDRIFCESSKKVFSNYLENNLGIPYTSETYQIINSVSEFSVLRPIGETGISLVMLPVHITGIFDSSGDATLSFIVRDTNISKRINNITGYLQGDFNIYYNNEIFADNTNGTPQIDDIIFDENNLYKTSELLAVRSANTGFSIVMYLSENDILEKFISFQKNSEKIIAKIMLLLAVISAFFAYINYRPVRRLKLKYNSMLPKNSPQNEIKQIESVIHNAVEKNRISQEKIDIQLQTLSEQKEILRKQLLLLILSGGYEELPEKGLYNMEMLRIDLSGPYYCVLRVRISNYKKKINEDQFVKKIEQLSDKDIKFYALKLTASNSLAVLLSFTEWGLVQEACELINALGEAENIELCIHIGLMCESIEDIPSSLVIALSRTDVYSQDTDIELESPRFANDSLKYDDTLLDLMIDDIRNSNSMDALSKLRLLIPESFTYKDSKIKQKYIAANIVSKLIKLSYEMRVHIDEETASLILISKRNSNLFSKLEHLIITFIKDVERKSNLVREELDEDIINYVKDNAFDSEITLNSLSQEFDLAGREISTIIKSKTGKNYKEYLITLRISRAKELLTKYELSVSETCNLAGYSDVSYFIRSFKSQTGHTPANYKQMFS